MKIQAKKGQGRMFWVLATILLIIFTIVIVLMMFTKGSEKGERGFLACMGKGGICETFEKCSEKGGIISEEFE